MILKILSCYYCFVFNVRGGVKIKEQFNLTKYLGSKFLFKCQLQTISFTVLWTVQKKVEHCSHEIKKIYILLWNLFGGKMSLNSGDCFSDWIHPTHGQKIVKWYTYIFLMFWGFFLCKKQSAAWFMARNLPMRCLREAEVNWWVNIHYIEPDCWHPACLHVSPRLFQECRSF